MTNTQTGTLVFKDQAGEYYLLPQETLEQGRVPEEHKAEIERLIAEQQDVQGYAMEAAGPIRWGIYLQVARVFEHIGWEVPHNI